MCVFFFQAEDGIRDLVRSRGLGDVYKRQGRGGAAGPLVGGAVGRSDGDRDATAVAQAAVGRPVSYTHLTLPTSDLV